MEIESALAPVDFFLAQDVDMAVDLIDENKDVFIMANWDSFAEVLDTIEFLVNPDVYRKSVAIVGWKVSAAMTSVIFVVFVLSEDGDLIIFV